MALNVSQARTAAIHVAIAREQPKLRRLRVRSGGVHAPRLPAPAAAAHCARGPLLRTILAWRAMPPSTRQISHTRPAEERDGLGLRNEVSRILIETGLPLADRHVRFIHFKDGELTPGSTTWTEAF